MIEDMGGTAHQRVRSQGVARAGGSHPSRRLAGRSQDSACAGRSGVASILSAPLDDEQETDQEQAEVDAAGKEKGNGTAHEEVLREFGM